MRLVCRESFVLDRDLDEYTGAGMRFVAGVTRVDAEHAVALAFPQFFRGPLRDRAIGRERTGTRAQTSTAAGAFWLLPATAARHLGGFETLEVPELRVDAAPSELSFSIGEHWLRPMRDEIYDNRELLEAGGETGGWLYGRRDGYRGYYLYPTNLGADGVRSEHRVTLGLEARQDEDRRAAASCDRDLFLLGSWHTHPFAKGYEAPSSTDRRNSLARLDRPDGESWVPATSFGLDLIVCPDGRRGYSKPHFFLWLTERSRLSGCGVTVPACFPETLSNW